MKLTAVLMVVAALHVSAKTVAQRVSLRVQHQPLEIALAKLKQQTGLLFIYNDREMARAKPVTLDVKEVQISSVLDMLFEDQPLNYELQENTVFIVIRPPAPPPADVLAMMAIPVFIKGEIVDSAGNPLIGASIQLNHARKYITTDDKGQFSLTAQTGDELTVSYVGYETLNMRVFANMTWLKLSMRPLDKGLKEVIVNTGYQTLTADRTTGSFVQVNNELYDRREGVDVLSKLDGIVSGMYFTTNGSNYLNTNLYTSPGNAGLLNPNNRYNITIRGQSTLSNLVSKDPLIIVDNFPYEGDINNLDPNMIESVTVLKDAAAASIWGARAGNGVIVLTTKKGKERQAMQVDFNENVSITGKRDIYKDRGFLDANDYINIEDTLFTKGYYDSYLTSLQYPAVSPVVAILAKVRAGQLSATDGTTQINALRNLDVRKDYLKYFYRQTTNQQYSISMRGGSNNATYALNVGYNNFKSELVRNQMNRLVIDASNEYTPIKNLEIYGGIIYSHLNTQSDNGFGWGSSSMYLNAGGNYALLPYTQLADAQGHSLPIARKFNQYYMDSTRKKGFLDWNYYPLQDLALNDNTNKQTDIVLNASVKYKFTSFLNLVLAYQNEYQTGFSRTYNDPQSFYMRDLVNSFTQVSSTGVLSYPVPLGGYLNLNTGTMSSNNYRALVNYNQNLGGKHVINAVAGGEVRQQGTTSWGESAYGYNDQYGTAVTNMNYNVSYVKNPTGSGTIGSPNGGYGITTNRFISYYSNLAYTYNDRYSFSLSGRKDGANIFGVKTNDKVKPLWSTGIGWKISSEKFYAVDWLPDLRFRATYGYNGNVYNGTAYLTARYSTSGLTGLQYASISNPPNPDLRWENVRNINIGIDFGTKSHVLTGSIEGYQKEGLDLLEPYPVEPSVGIGSYISGGNGIYVTKNAASTRSYGTDITLNSKNIDRKFKWYSTFIFSTVRVRIIDYAVPQTSSSIQSSGIGLKGRPLSGMYSYRWAGLDPTNGDPQGYLGGKVSKNYSGIINNYNPDSVVFSGSSIPTIYGSFRNTFGYNGFILSFNIKYKLGYVMRRPTPSINLSDEVYLRENAGYTQRWQKPGDEKFTSVPSFVYPSNTLREQFYQFSSATVEKGGMIRLQDINLSYDLKASWLNKSIVRGLRVFANVDNVGLIWKANKAGLDPDYGYIPPRRSYVFGIKSSF